MNLLDTGDGDLSISQILSILFLTGGSGGILGWYLNARQAARRAKIEEESAERQDEQTDREFYVEENRKLRRDLDEVRARVVVLERTIATYEGMIQLGALRAEAVIKTHCPNWESCPYLLELKKQEVAV